MLRIGVSSGAHVLRTIAGMPSVPFRFGGFELEKGLTDFSNGLGIKLLVIGKQRRDVGSTCLCTKLPVASSTSVIGSIRNFYAGKMSFLFHQKVRDFLL